MKLLINKDVKDLTPMFKAGDTVAMLTPPIGESYWLFKVKLSKKQAIVGFPKFCTIGIGFQVESHDWNVNLPFQTDAETIFNHIKCNKGDDTINDEDCIKAIEMIQEAASSYMKAKRGDTNGD